MTTAESGAEAARVARGLAYVCRHLDELRTLLDDDGTDPSKPLAKLVTALQGQAAAQQPTDGGQSRPSVAGLLDQVHAAVQAAGDALGVYGSGVRSGGQTGMEALQVVFRCPLGRCAGRPADRVAGPPPVCTVSPAGLPLIRERLP
jgi:hypothetical protein